MQRSVDDFIEYLSSEKGFSPNTLAAYRSDLAQFLQFLTSPNADHQPRQSWSAVEQNDIMAYILDLKDPSRRSYAEATVARKVAAIKSFFHFLTGEGLIKKDPTEHLDSPHVKKTLPKYLSVSQIDLLLRQPDKFHTPEARRDKAMLELLYATGMRVTELVSLNVGDVNLAQGYVRCMGKGIKQRQISIHNKAVEALQVYLDGARPKLVKNSRERALFVNHRGERLTRQGFWLILKGHGKAANIAPTITPHTLRHSVATHLLRGGMPLREVQELLGHASISTTEIYTHLTDDHVREVYDQAHPRAKE